VKPRTADDYGRAIGRLMNTRKPSDRYGAARMLGLYGETPEAKRISDAFMVSMCAEEPPFIREMFKEPKP